MWKLCSRERLYRKSSNIPRNAILRSDKSFKLKQQEEHHKMTSNLEDLNIGIITQFSIDYMHLVLLGIMKRLLQFWIKDKYNIRMTPTQITLISTSLLSMSQYLPKEFARKPRGLNDVDRFKPELRLN